MSDEQRAFLNAIHANPDDDLVRLVYADWLDEQDQPERAEFIRVQVRLEEIRRTIRQPDEDHLHYLSVHSRSSGVWCCPGDSAERRELAFRYRSLLDAHEAEWLAPFREVLHNEWYWSRGFLDVVQVAPEALAESAEELFGSHPIRRLILTGPGQHVGALAAIPNDNCLASADLIYNDLDPDALRALTRFKHLAGLTELNLAFCGLRDSAVDFLCGEPFFQRLTLGLCGNPFTDDGRQRLRDHFGPRVGFERKRHPNRLFAFAGMDIGYGHQEYYGIGAIHAGFGHDRVQLLLEVCAHSDTLRAFDHAGDLLRIETRERWGVQEQQRADERHAWLSSLGYRPAPIRVGRIPDVYDYPKSWAELFDRPDTEPEDLAAGREIMDRWLREDIFRYGSLCGGWWHSRKSGEQIES